MNSIDTSPLSWVIEEVRSVAAEAQEALSKYRASRNDTASLHMAKSHVHQMHGAMQMLDIPGLSVLSEATEALLARFDQAPDTATPAALNAAEQAVNALIAYSDELLAGSQHQPLRLYPYLQDVLQGRGAERIHPADLFFPALGTRLKFDTAARPTSPDELRTKRRDYELGLLGVLNGQISDTNLLPMRQALSVLADVQPGPQARTFWTVAVALFDAMRERTVPVDINVKRLAARLNLQFKRAVEGAPNIAERLLRDALYFVARSTSTAPLVLQVQEQFQLQGSIPADFELQRFVRVDRDLLTAAKEKVAQLKGVWNQAAGVSDGPEGARARPEVMQQFSTDATALVDLLDKLNQQHAKRLADKLASISADFAARSQPVSDALGLETASSLLFLEMVLNSIYIQDSRQADRVEAVISRIKLAAQGSALDVVEPWLNELARKEQEKSTLAQLAGELSGQLGAVEKNLDAYFRNPADKQAVTAADAPLSQVQGALGLLGFEPAQQAIAHVRERLTQFSAEDYAPQEQDFASLAETYGRLTLAVEAFVRDPQGERERYTFDVRTGQLRERAVARDAAAFVENEDILPVMTAQPAEALPSSSVELELEQQQKKTLEIFEALERAPEDPKLKQELSASLDLMRESATLVDDERAAASSTLALQALKDPAGSVQSMQSLAQAMEQMLPTAPAVVQTAPAPADQAGIDAELLEIFLAEAQEVLETLHSAHAHAQQHPADVENLTTLRRGFHTLKGSGRMVGLEVFGQAAWSMEQVYNHWLAEGKAANAELLKLTERASSEMRLWIDEIALNGYSSRKAAPFEVAAHAVRDGHAFAWPAEASAAMVPVEVPAPAIEVVTLQEPPPEPVVIPEDIKHVGDVSISLPLFNIYMAESDENTRRLLQELSEWQQESERPVSELALRLAHTLSGSSATVGLESLHALGAAMEQTLLAARRTEAQLEPAQHVLLHSAATQFSSMLSTAAAGDNPAVPADLISQLNTLTALLSEPPIEKPVEAPSAQVVHLDDYLHGQHHAAAVPVPQAMAQEQPVQPPGPQMDTQVDVLIDQDPLQVVPQTPLDELSTPLIPEPEPMQPVATVVVTPAQTLASLSANVAPPVTPVAPQALVQTAEDTLRDEIDPELFEIFATEAQEGLPLLTHELRAWQKAPAQQAHPQALMRVLHTLKGSARMAGALRVGQGAHEMETQIEHALASSSLPADLFEKLSAQADRLQLLFDVASGHAPESALKAYEEDEPAVQLPVTQVSSADVVPAAAMAVEPPARAKPAMPMVTIGPAVMAAQPAANALATKPAQTAALVRVRSDILDRLVNQAGEVAIARTKVESEVEGIRGALGELTENVLRLRNQLREIEIQAESQMASRLDFAREHTADFDPLEFDRFTRLQELTRLMAESVADVATVQQNLVKSLGEADRDLGTQARLTRDLTQDLMRVRMVPFDSVSDRLYRVVRQAARDSGKRVNLDIRGGQVELDRGVLERMVAPFEHLLRNSVAHGVEPGDARAARGKAETGQLTVDVRQEGNEIRITFNDDGNGLDFARIRQRGVERGLIASDANPAENELTELIFAPGFTTATELTTLAGRGVGMDVVRAESASLGGRISVTSQAGQGSQFTVFLPLTLAVTQVVLVRVGEHTAALPAALVAEVQQLKAQALAAAYNEGQVLSRGHRVPMHYLAQLLALDDATAMAQRYSPVVIMAQGEERTAIHVDEVIGTREVIVKNIGPQLARVLGIAGATVLGSGEVVLIINPIPLAQRFGRHETSAPGAVLVGGAVAELVDAPAKAASEPSQGLHTLPVVMVVDDSLTVRKVTQRLLTREGFQVVLAKDGVDALRQLQDVTPDVMLVDIEMPRMDGFDLTRNVRGDARYATTPIIMITSRTADKHRNMAMELGVNQFLGKPYQDEELLGHIRSYVKHKMAQLI
jgi:chemosensory pili system protein ChpA (sensor histidine kinase/response regulator)